MCAGWSRTASWWPSRPAAVPADPGRSHRSTGLSWSLDDAGRHEPVAEAGLEAFLGEVADVGPAALDQTRLVLRLPLERVAALRAELDELLGRYAAEPVAVYLALYPGDPPGETDRTAARGTWDTRGQDD